MPIGLVVIHWDERMGPETLVVYPAGTSISEDTITELYTQHEFSGNIGLITLRNGTDNIASYYTGKEQAIYLMLLLSPEEEGELFEDGLAEASSMIDTNLNSMIPTIYQRVAAYSIFNDEQRLAIIWESEIKQNIIKSLREGAIQKIELVAWLKDQFKLPEVEADALLGSLAKAGIIRLASVKGFSSEIVFLIEDIRAYRQPPAELVHESIQHHLSGALKEEYLQKTRQYFKTFSPDQVDQDIPKIINKIILDPIKYKILKQLRHSILTRNDLEGIMKKGASEIDVAMNAFIENELVKVLIDKNGQLYYCLICDFQIEKFYPEYLLNIIANQYRNRAQNQAILMKSLEILHEEFEANLIASKHPPKKIIEIKGSKPTVSADKEIEQFETEIVEDIQLNAN
jgi:DNA-binding transcriptional ArsR family regulator